MMFACAVTDRFRGARSDVLRQATTNTRSHRMHLLRQFWTDESGQDLVEYALLLVLVTVSVIVAMRLLGTTIASFWNNISNNLSSI
jgi:Flp pilus assembly pilin Flp